MTSHVVSLDSAAEGGLDSARKKVAPRRSAADETDSARFGASASLSGAAARIAAAVAIAGSDPETCEWWFVPWGASTSPPSACAISSTACLASSKPSPHTASSAQKRGAYSQRPTRGGHAGKSAPGPPGPPDSTDSTDSTRLDSETASYTCESRVSPTSARTCSRVTSKPYRVESVRVSSSTRAADRRTRRFAPPRFRVPDANALADSSADSSLSSDALPQLEFVSAAEPWLETPGSAPGSSSSRNA